MKLFRVIKPFFFAFLIAAGIYFASFKFIENRRTHRGPWQVTFSTVSNAPVLVIDEPELKISDFKIIFIGPSSTNALTHLKFAVPQEVPFKVPFGVCIFEDTTFQPGTVVFNLFGHEVQLMRRVLTIDKQEYAWNTPGGVTISKAGILPAVP